jgi:uncharacterized membrane protein
MPRINWKAHFYNFCFALNCLLLFLAIFGAKMEVPVVLQLAGRVHPLVLHFPIVLLLISGLWELGQRKTGNPFATNLGDTLLLSSAVSGVFTALMGLLLSNEGGYSEDTMVWHQWTGIAVSVIAWGWYSFRGFIRSSKALSMLIAGISWITLTFAGHYGATLTHGENYLFAPASKEIEKSVVPLEEAFVYEHLVRPILKEKCMGCHNSAKQKGELNMETEAMLLKGGKNGVLWDSTAKQFGLLLQRVHLSPEAEEHMPPKGKAQLTSEEILVLYHWIRQGANFSQKISDLPATDSLRLLAMTRLKSKEEVPYPFQAADEVTIQKLNNDYRAVVPAAMNSPALGVDFYGISAFKSSDLKDLEVVKEQIVHLNLSKMPLKDEDLKFIAAFTNLRGLNLSFTQITGATLGALNGLKNLISISLSGTSVKYSDLELLRNLTELSELYLWNTAVTPEEILQLQKSYPKIRIESGYNGKGVVAKLNAPIIEGDEQVFSTITRVKLKNFIQGAAVRYTLDGSVPDSLKSLLATGDSITIEKSCQLIAKAFLPGWISSEVSTRSFYKTGILPDSIVLLFPPNPQYKGEGPKTLANKKIGDTDFRTNKWLGYKETNLEALFLFTQPTTLSSVTFSTLVDIGSYIMPAAEIQVWGGNDPQHLTLLKKIIPPQPEKVGMPGYKTGFNCSFEAKKLRVLKIVAKPVKKLPAWHPGKGEMGWVFIDEVFFE